MNPVDLFKDSLLYVMFPNLDSDAGEALLQSVADYVMGCMGGDEIQENCPKLFECFVIHAMAYIIANWGFSVEDDSFTVPPVAQSANLYLKKKTVGQETCEWAEVSSSNTAECVDCDSNTLTGFKVKFEEAKNTCNMAMQCLPMGGGSNFPDCNVNTGCCGADKAH